MLALEDQILRMEDDIKKNGIFAYSGILAFALNDADLGKFVEAYRISLENYLISIPNAVRNHKKKGHDIQDVAIALVVDDFDKCVPEQTYISEGNISKINFDQDKKEKIFNYLEEQGYIKIWKDHGE